MKPPDETAANCNVVMTYAVPQIRPIDMIEVKGSAYIRVKRDVGKMVRFNLGAYERTLSFEDYDEFVNAQVALRNQIRDGIQ